MLQGDSGDVTEARSVRVIALHRIPTLLRGNPSTLAWITPITAAVATHSVRWLRQVSVGHSGHSGVSINAKCQRIVSIEKRLGKKYVLPASLSKFASRKI